LRSLAPGYLLPRLRRSGHCAAPQALRPRCLARVELAQLL